MGTKFCCFPIFQIEPIATHGLFIFHFFGSFNFILMLCRWVWMGSLNYFHLKTFWWSTLLWKKKLTVQHFFFFFSFFWFYYFWKYLCSFCAAKCFHTTFHPDAKNHPLTNLLANTYLKLNNSMPKIECFQRLSRWRRK